MPRGPLQLTVAVRFFSATFICSPLSVVASHLMSGGTVTLSSIGVLSLYLSQLASLIAIESGNLSPGLATWGPSEVETYSLIARIEALTLASRASRSAGGPAR